MNFLSHNCNLYCLSRSSFVSSCASSAGCCFVQGGSRLRFDVFRIGNFSGFDASAASASASDLGRVSSATSGVSTAASQHSAVISCAVGLDCVSTSSSGPASTGVTSTSSALAFLASFFDRIGFGFLRILTGSFAARSCRPACVPRRREFLLFRS